MTALMVAVIGGLVASAAMAIVRMVRGESVVERIVALDTLVVMAVSILAVHAAATGEGTFLDVAVVLALLGFTGTTLLARLIERRGR